MPHRPILDIAALRSGLPGLARVEVIQECPSTNTILLHQLTQGHAKDLTLLVAEHQTAGHGRSGRTWVTPPRTSLTLSLGLAPVEVAPQHLGWLPLIGGVAVVDTLVALGLPAALKWPNDVLLRPDPPARAGKVCGILAAGDTEHAVLGIGLNVTQQETELPVATATSMQLAGSGTVDRTVVLIALVRRLLEVIHLWRAQRGDPDPSGILQLVRERTSTVGHEVRAELPGGLEPLCGTAVDIDAGGRLVVRKDDGQQIAVAAADVHHVRPRSVV